MKLLLPLALLASVVPVSAATIDVPSTIESVELFIGAARVTRTFEVNLPADPAGEIRFLNLPITADLQSAQLALSGDDGIVIGQVTADKGFTQEDESEALRALYDRVDAIQKQIADVEHETARSGAWLDYRKELIESMRKGIEEKGNEALVDRVLQAWPDTEAAARDAYAAQWDLKQRKEQLARDLSEAQAELNQRLMQERMASAELNVRVASNGGTVRGRLSYVVRGATLTWEPRYMLRADPAGEQVEIVYQAAVSQSSGEDWKDVELTLGTATPAVGNQATEPGVVYLQKVDPRRAEMAVAQDKVITLSPFSVSAKESDDRGYGAMQPPPAAVAATTSGFTATLPTQVTVESGKPAVVLTLLTDSAKARFWSETIPVTAESAYLMAEFENPLELPMLAGQGQYFVDGVLNGLGRIDLAQPGEEVSVGFGTNGNIKVERVTLKQEAGSSGLFGRRNQETRRYETRLTNLMPVAQRVIIKDSVPISQDSKIEVKLLKPEKVDVDPETGLFTYEKTLAPGEEFSLETSFVVTWPSDWMINGGF